MLCLQNENYFYDKNLSHAIELQANKKSEITQPSGAVVTL